jgi:transposase
MKRTELLQEIRKMRFEEAYGGWEAGRLTQVEAASLLGVCERTFRRYLSWYEEGGMEGLIDRRLEQVSHRKAPVDEVMALTASYRSRHLGWSAKHFYAWYRKDGGTRSYTWVKSRLQEEALVPKAGRAGYTGSVGSVRPSRD